MTITRTSSSPGLPGGYPFSLASEADGVCFISGMPSLDPEGTFWPGTFEEETDRAWHNVVAIAEAAGFSTGEFVYVQCVLADISDYGGSTTGGDDSSPTSPRLPPGSRSRRARFRSARRSRSRRSLPAAAERAGPRVPDADRPHLPPTFLDVIESGDMARRLAAQLRWPCRHQGVAETVARAQ